MRCTATVQLAVVPTSVLRDAPQLEPIRNSSTSDRMRNAINRLRIPGDTREALHALIDGYQSLERELFELRRVLQLERQGIELVPESISIGPDGMCLERRVALPDDTEVFCFVDIRVWGRERLLRLNGSTRTSDGRTTLEFRNIAQEDRDLLVAFVFQQQGRERRRALNNDLDR